MAHDGIRLYAAVGLGSGIGAAARYLCSVGLIALLGPAFPWGTFAANVLGSFLIGLYAALAGGGGRLHVSPAVSQFVMAGFCGGFTTFSILSLETLLLVQQAAYALAAIHALVAMCLWLIAVSIGFRIGLTLNRLKGS